MRWWLVLLAPAPLLAHMVSISTGELRVTGAAATYELHMPLYEVAHVRGPEQAFFEHIHFRGGGGPARLLTHSCAAQQAAYVCTGEYQFPAPPDDISVECTFAAITVPNHVHVLHATRDGKSDQAVFDLSFTTADVRFRPPTWFEAAVRQMAAGFLRAVEGAAPLLFLAALVLASRSRAELMVLTAALIGGELAAVLFAPAARLALSPRFIEAAAALTVAYLALEIVLLPEARARWAVVAVLGILQGLYFAAFLSGSGYAPWTFFGGVAVAQAAVISLLALFSHRLLRAARVVPIAASLLLSTGLGWFFLRLWK